MKYCCAVDCKLCSGPGSRAGCVFNPECPALCNPKVQLDKGLCNGCRSFRPNRLSKKQARKKKVEERKKSRYSGGD